MSSPLLRSQSVKFKMTGSNGTNPCRLPAWTHTPRRHHGNGVAQAKHDPFPSVIFAQTIQKPTMQKDLRRAGDGIVFPLKLNGNSTKPRSGSIIAFRWGAGFDEPHLFLLRETFMIYLSPLYSI